MEFTNSAKYKTKHPRRSPSLPMAQQEGPVSGGPTSPTPLRQVPVTHAARRTAEHGRRTRGRDIARYFSFQLPFFRFKKKIPFFPNPSG